MAPKDEDVKEKEPVKINKWDSSSVKNSLDDAVKEVMTNTFNYEENFALMDGRLTICTVAVGVAMFALLWDYLYPFPDSRPVLIFSVTTYFIMMGILTLYTTYKEKSIFAVYIQKEGARKGAVWDCSSTMGKYDDKYELHLSCKELNGRFRESQTKKSCANFITINGFVCQDLVDKEVLRLHSTMSVERKEK